MHLWSCQFELRRGWVAWFIIAAIAGKPITIYGDGKQVRDVIYVDDLPDCYDLQSKVDQSAGQIFILAAANQPWRYGRSLPYT